MSVTEENEITIESYEQSADLYEAVTRSLVDTALRRWLDMAVESIPVNAAIFEIGSGTGRDALYLQEKGYTVLCSDATEAFLVQLSKKGFDPAHFNVITDTFDQQYDLILADAVLLHVTKFQFHDALIKIASALNINGRFALTMKEGEGEAWTNSKVGRPRYFCYWSENELRAALEKAGLVVIDLSYSGKQEARWINIVACKQ